MFKTFINSESLFNYVDIRVSLIIKPKWKLLCDFNKVRNKEVKETAVSYSIFTNIVVKSSSCTDISEDDAPNFTQSLFK